MIVIKNQEELQIMKRACVISAKALQVGGQAIKPGVTTAEIDRAIEDYIRSEGAVPSFLGYNGFPASACISVNNQVIHGIPDTKTTIKEGDIVSIDVGANIDGFHGDNAYTFVVGEVSKEVQALLDTTQECLRLGIEQAVLGNRIGDISHAIQVHAEAAGYGVVKEFVGHGIGREMHEDPQVPNFGRAGFGPRLEAGMTLAIEPMINQFGAAVRMLDDGWTVLTQDGGMSAHFEHTVAITEDGPLILTQA